MIPKARKNDLQIEQSGNEFTVYDQATDTSVCLDHVTAQIRKKCNGINSPCEIQRLLLAENGLKVNEDTIWFSLTRLKRLNLLELEDDSIERYSSLLETQDLSKKYTRGSLSKLLVKCLGMFSNHGKPLSVKSDLYHRES